MGVIHLNTNVFKNIVVTTQCIYHQKTHWSSPHAWLFMKMPWWLLRAIINVWCVYFGIETRMTSIPQSICELILQWTVFWWHNIFWIIVHLNNYTNSINTFWTPHTHSILYHGLSHTILSKYTHSTFEK